MAKNIRKFKLESEFISVYNGDEYIEPWVSLCTETSGVAYDKVYLKEIEIKNLKMVGNVPASGATVNKDNCTYVVNAVYSNYSREDITEQAEVTGSLVVEASQVEQSHLAGVLTLTATYLGKEASASVKVYQEAFVPSITVITIDNLTWNVDIPSSGGTANKDNCTYTITAHYNVEGMTEDVTELASVTGSLVVEASQEGERHAAGTLTLTAEYSGITGSADVIVYQEEYSNYLKFNILSGGNIAFGNMLLGDGGTPTPLTIEYKKNDGEWTSLTSTLLDTSSSAETLEDLVNSFSSKFSVDAGDVVKFRGNNQAYASLENNEFNIFLSTASFNVEGNIMSLIDKNNFDSLKELTTPATFTYLFSGCHGLISAENLLLPATTLADYCYYGMFFNALGFGYGMALTTAPKLPATTLAEYCYDHMFYGCTNLETAPSVLPATTLTNACYQYMFDHCTSLTQAPELPATTLATHCYENMFQNCKSLTTVPAIGNSTTIMADYACKNMFGYCTSLTQAPELPATTLASKCYYSMFVSCTSLTTVPAIGNSTTIMADYACASMFSGCTSLTTAPELPATTLASYCYLGMFADCTSLTTAPELPATTLASYCYRGMFAGCTKLTQAPELPATTLASYCYSSMFSNCTSLTTAPALPATTLTSGCYNNMFSYCTSLTTAPELPATTLAQYCYHKMFAGCRNLNYIKCLATNISTTGHTNGWVYGVAGTGTFVKNPDMLSWTIGDNGIPSNWKIRDPYIPYTADTSTVAESGEVRTITLDITDLVASSIAIDIEGASDVTYIYDNGVITVTFPENESTARDIAVSINAETVDGEILKTKIMFNQGITLRSTPLTFNITSGGTIMWITSNTALTRAIEYSKNGGEWTSITSNTGSSAPSIPVDAGDIVKFRGDNAAYSAGSSKYCSFGSSTPDLRFNAYGNIMSLVESTDFKNLETFAIQSAFTGLFSGCTSLVEADELLLPAETLASCCYNSMFQGCTSLAQAPALPAITLASKCYYSMFVGCKSLTTVPAIGNSATTMKASACTLMFSGCTSLTTAPELPATTLAIYCYYDMFFGCTNLTQAPELPATTLATHCYRGMFFGCTNLTQAPELPATTLASDCYGYMFNGCSSLTKAPALPAETLEYGCYGNMFSGCTSLTTAPELPATTLADFCYCGMFQGCTSLEQAPELPATTLATHCYESMFQNCKSLTTAPELPATTLATHCYGYMFQNCKSLTTAPTLPATRLTIACYIYMFKGCTSLNCIKCLATNISASSCTGDWVNGVAASGTFVKNPDMLSWTTGVHGIPSGWTVQDAS